MFKTIAFQTQPNTPHKAAFINIKSVNTGLSFKSKALKKDSFVSQVDCALDTIPKKDQKILSSFFHILIEEFEWGYTIFGNKPISNTDGETERILNKGWQTWQKHKDKFALKNFIIKRNDDDGICIINKKSVNEKIQQHIKLFKEVLGDTITPQKIIQSLEKGTRPLNDVALEGILYGYGEKNSLSFKRLFNISHLNPTGRTVSEIYVADKDKVPSEGFNSIEEELNHLIKELYSNNFEEVENEEIPLPIFCAIKSDLETIGLKKAYKEQQAVIEKVNNDPNFLKLVLKRLSN